MESTENNYCVRRGGGGGFGQPGEKARSPVGKNVRFRDAATTVTFAVQDFCFQRRVVVIAVHATCSSEV